MNMEQIYWSPGVTLEALEKQAILKAFNYFKENKTQTSIALGISIRTLEARLEKYAKDEQDRFDVERREAEERDSQLKRARGIVGQAPVPQGRVDGSNAGVHMEPPHQTSTQQPMPMPERPEVQSVLPPKAAVGREHRRR